MLDAMTIRPLLRAALALFLVLAARPALADEAPSFDCARAATKIERTICADPSLAADDALMARLYAAAKVSAFGSGASNIGQSQRAWLKERQGCERPVASVWPSVAACLRDSYASRLQELAVTALFNQPDLALVTLRRVDAEAAPLYEAIWRYASAQPGAEPRGQIAPLLAPFFVAERPGASMLAGYDLPDAKAALVSDADFARFLKIASVHVESAPTPHQLPCAAIVRRPALLDAMGPEFGATMDNFIMFPDCAETLPPMPALAALDRAIFAGWPDCEGSMRFLFYRSHARDVTAARLGFEPEQAVPGKPPVLTGVTRAMIAAAETELAGVYRAYRGLDEASAASRARANVRAVLQSGQQCDIGEDG
jgi:uncharacterized protein